MSDFAISSIVVLGLKIGVATMLFAGLVVGCVLVVCGVRELKREKPDIGAGAMVLSSGLMILSVSTVGLILMWIVL